MNLGKRKVRQRRKAANRRAAITYRQRKHQRVRRWRFENPELQRILRAMTNWQLTRWLRGGAPKSPTEARVFLLAQRRVKPPTPYDYILEKHS